MRGDIFSLFFQLFQFDQITVETLYNGHLRDIEESGHCREVERRVNVCHVWTVRQKKKKNGPCREVPVKEEVGTLVRRFDSISHDTTTIFSGIW